MIGLLTVWFGPLAGLAAEPGYFYLCPRCYGRVVAPHLEAVRERLGVAHPGVEPGG